MIDRRKFLQGVAGVFVAAALPALPTSDTFNVTGSFGAYFKVQIPDDFIVESWIDGVSFDVGDEIQITGTFQDDGLYRILDKQGSVAFIKREI